MKSVYTEIEGRKAIIKLLKSEDREFYISEISEKLKMDLKLIHKILTQLEKENIIESLWSKKDINENKASEGEHKCNEITTNTIGILFKDDAWWLIELPYGSSFCIAISYCPYCGKKL